MAIKKECDYEYRNHYRDNLKFISYYEKDHKYIYEYDNEVDLNFYDNKQLIKEMHEYLSYNSPKNLLLGNFKSLNLSNCRGINKDVRGVRYLDSKLYFWENFRKKRETGITLHGLNIAAFSFKNHKFKNNYEMYCGVNDFTISDDDLIIDVRFDHGS